MGGCILFLSLLFFSPSDGGSGLRDLVWLLGFTGLGALLSSSGPFIDLIPIRGLNPPHSLIREWGKTPHPKGSDY